jgi:hypothetical protein
MASAGKRVMHSKALGVAGRRLWAALELRRPKLL